MMTATPKKAVSARLKCGAKAGVLRQNPRTKSITVGYLKKMGHVRADERLFKHSSQKECLLLARIYSSVHAIIFLCRGLD